MPYDAFWMLLLDSYYLGGTGVLDETGEIVEDEMDLEIEAMGKVSKALGGLEEEGGLFVSTPTFPAAISGYRALFDVGPDTAPHTRVGGLKRGVLEVIVANAVLLQELTHFHKRRLLEQLRRRLPGTTVTDLRFRPGGVKEERS